MAQGHDASVGDGSTMVCACALQVNRTSDLTLIARRVAETMGSRVQNVVLSSAVLTAVGSGADANGV